MQPKSQDATVFQQYEALLTGKWITDLSNSSAFLMDVFPNINWVGFYLMEDGKLLLGPFQGKPACTEITLNRGVCGHAATTQKTVVVPDVHAFPGHITCDPRSRSEVVVPLMKNGQLIGVLDVDSATPNRFTENDALFFEKIVTILLSKK